MSDQQHDHLQQTGARRGKAGRGGRRSREDFGRSAYKRTRDDNHLAKRFKPNETREEAANAEGVEAGEKEERRPKKKVAVMLSYCGTGYRGMQVNPPHRTVEGDLFEAFVKAGAISKANSNDPKKSSLVRCARTDKGVHAAGNVISLKLIIEDPDIIPKINAELPPQIRIWDLIPTISSFSAYNQCDSRKYEYLLPSHVFLPPHPTTFLGKALQRYAEQENDLSAYLERQEDVLDWWSTVDAKVNERLTEDQATINDALDSDSEHDPPWGDSPAPIHGKPAEDIAQQAYETRAASEPLEADDPKAELLRKVRDIHMQEKRNYRISPKRLAKVRESFEMFVGTKCFHNYTVDKTFKDPSAKRHIKSFEVADPIIINGTEWLAVRVHGQSFMMHQIRKMVGMVMMAVRCGCPISRISETFRGQKLSIGKAPGLGLHLEYPIFDHYNDVIAKRNERPPLVFTKYAEEIQKFKDEWIYSKIFEEEERANTFTNFVQFLDTYKCATYLYLTSAGFKALEGVSTSEKDVTKDAPEDESDQSEGES